MSEIVIRATKLCHKMSDSEYFRQKNRDNPIVRLRMPSPETLDELRQVAVANSTTVSGYVRALIFEALEKEQTKASA